jgi:hypothetical protein
MPTPQTTLFRPDSVSKGGTCKMNLRGSSLYDYADENAGWTHNSVLTVQSISQATSWAYFIPKSTLFNVTDVVTRGSLLSSSPTNFTIMFRFITPSNQEPGMTGTTILFNGDAPPGPTPPFPNAFWGFLLTGSDQNSLQFQFLYLRGGNLQSFIVASQNIQENTWYHVAVTISDNGDGTSAIRGFLNGVRTYEDPMFANMDVPSGSTKIGNAAFGQAQAFSLTEIVFLEKAFTTDEVKGYSSSAYI